ncbi:Transcription factor, fungi [Penicillium expansum]|uniref:Transcription factor, fungi n=1 Tax=Penicillium expansum TaxID=27334 RepID=A0A0A2JVC0_PENEN|nr:Transcription factor, fungi [Penicillium expansum]KGO42093.1 Transcription factor, fungi [Penicillium expansum]KGO56135.1 Transcription factor, fungi [Penicillium expansum]KGO70568.1 Transcription factor, fungi [Penicillium expansum]
MATTTSPVSGENEEDPAPMNDFKYSPDDDHHSPTHDPSTTDPKSLPAQKRRRVGRACDECRRKKIKCDGKQPCTHCTVYSYECSYDQPSNRRRNPAPQYVEALENRLQKAEALLRIVLPNVDLDDPQLDVHATEQKFAAAQKSRQATEDVKPSVVQETAQEGADEGLLETMVDNSGCLDRDDQGHWDYHGHTSGVLFVRRLRKQLGAADISGPMSRSRPSITAHMLDSPKSMSESPQDTTLPPTHDLPPREVARRLCHNAIDHACSLMKFVHIPSFFASLDRIYDTPPEQFTNQENAFLPLLYIVIAVGCLFSDDESGQGTLDVSGYEGAIGQGFQYFKAGRQLLEITDCRDLVSLQAICFMVLFLQSSAKLSTCYSYVGIALRSALRLGLHRSVAADFNPLERELRKRIFWVVRKMDIYVSTLLGLPQMLSDDDIDQEYPMEVDGDYITTEGITQPPSNYTPLMAGCNAHTRLSNIILKVVKYIYPVKNARYRSKSDQRYMVSHSKIREIERDLQNWMEELPPALRPGTEVSPQLERVRQLLRISYAHVQMVMYRPFLHYVSGGSQARGVDKRSYACAAACVSVSRNIVHITTGMQKRGLLNGSFWFTMYTTYFAILSLIFFVLENPDSPTAKDGVLKDAMEGKNTLAGLAKKSLAADRCSQSLNCLFKTLPEMLKNRQSSKTPVNLKRPAPSNIAEPEQKSSFEKTLPHRSSTFPVQMMSQPAVNDDQNRRQRSLDNVQPVSNRSTDINHQSTWISNTPDLLTETMTTPEHISSSGMTPSIPTQEPSSLAWAQQFTNPSNLPDLMPMMFPSDDPFAYPTQPMSTLEDDHFRHDPTGMPSQYPFDSASGMGPATPGEPSSAGVSTPTFDFTNMPNYPIANTPGIKSSVPSHLRPSHSRTSSRVHSPISQSQTPSEVISSPDLVSIPNQNFVWQGYNFQPSNPNDMGTESAPQQPEMPGPNGIPDFVMGMDENMGMNMDLGISFDDLFGNNAAYRPSNGASAEDWAQWMNANSI